MTTPIEVTSEFLVNTTTAGAQAQPTITMLSDGRFVVAWRSDEGQNGIIAQIFNADGTMSGGEIVVTATSNPEAAPSITALPGGGFVVSWQELGGDGSGDGIRAQIVSGAGTLSGSPILVNTTTTGDQFGPTMTTLADGRFVVVWNDNSGGTIDVRAQIFNADGTKFGSEFIVNDATTVASIAPTAALADGRFVVVWHDSTGGTLDIGAQIFNADGTTSGGEIAIDAAIASGFSSLAVAALAGGGFVITWQDSSLTAPDTSGLAIRAQIVAADGSLSGSEFLVNTTTTAIQQQPVIAALDTGQFVIAWQDFSAGGSPNDAGLLTTTRAQVFNADGSTCGSEFVVATTTTSQFDTLAIEALAGGQFIVSWQQQQSGGGFADTEIGAQIFEVPTFEGLSHGYWKNHMEDWDLACLQTDGSSFESFFGVDAASWIIKAGKNLVTGDDITFAQGLSLPGGGMSALAREAVAAVLNACDEDVTYAFTVDDIKDIVQDAFATGDFETAKNQLEAQNTLGLEADMII